MPTELPKSFDPKAAQARWLTLWDERGYFRADPAAPGEAFSIVIPPPNVTGALHMGHALNGTLQDVLVRWRRMQGRNTLWVPGTDHAGIATQAVVEKLVMQTEQKTRHDLGREELVSRIWAWKDRYEARILGQLKQIGASCDWSRTAFTLDAACSRAVRETFFAMFRDGYIYRGKRLVNWDTQLQTSVADDETYTADTPGGFWTCKYPVVGSPDEFIRFSTTRPETMLGDTAVCVHPSDERYKHLVGRTVLQPHSGREIPVIADALLADPTLGTGCVKVTPAHDPNDYACWTRHPEIGVINILNPDGTINAAGGEYAGLDRMKAREAVIARMEELGLFEGREDRVIPLKYSDRSKSPIEPLLSDQWFVRMADRDDGKPGLAQLAMDAVASGKVTFTPERYAKTYLDWLSEKRDWCVSRQLWWGHRIPIWYTDAPESAVAAAFAGRDNVAWRTDPETGRVLVCATTDVAADAVPGFTLAQDPDVLDTWFSSALWPSSTLGWPEPTADLTRYHPTSTLVTSRDIITLWVARMVLMGLYNTAAVPFRDVYITPKLLDGFGETMSKTRGNGVDPLDIIEQYGTDALRYYCVSIAGDTQDSRLPAANVCPHCGTLIPLKRENTDADERKRPKKVTCSACKKPFRPGGPWTSDDAELPTARLASDRFEVGRNFANKLWNATRFLLQNLDGYTPEALDYETLATEDRWIVSRLATTTTAVTAALEAYKFAEVARLVYEFAWTEFCDWFIEMSKGRLKEPAERATAQRVLIGVLDGLVRLVHPVMPFVAESLWQALNEAAPVRGLDALRTGEDSVCIAPWPAYPAAATDPRTEVRIARMQELIRGVREVRNRYMLDKTLLALSVMCSPEVAAELTALAPFVASLGGVRDFECGPAAVKPALAAGIVRPEFAAYVSLAGLIDPAAEATRTEKQIADIQKQVAGMAGKLANEAYVRGAPAEVVEETRAKVRELERQVETLRANLTDLRTGA